MSVSLVMSRSVARAAANGGPAFVRLHKSFESLPQERTLVSVSRTAAYTPPDRPIAPGTSSAFGRFLPGTDGSHSAQPKNGRLLQQIDRGSNFGGDFGVPVEEIMCAFDRLYAPDSRMRRCL